MGLKIDIDCITINISPAIVSLVMDVIAIVVPKMQVIIESGIVCIYVVFVCITKWLEHKCVWYLNVAGFNARLSQVGANKRLSHIFSLPNCMMETWWPGVYWISSLHTGGISGSCCGLLILPLENSDLSTLAS